MGSFFTNIFLTLASIRKFTAAEISNFLKRAPVSAQNDTYKLYFIETSVIVTI